MLSISLVVVPTSSVAHLQRAPKRERPGFFFTFSAFAVSRYRTDWPLMFRVRYLYVNSAWSGLLIICRLTTPARSDPSTLKCINRCSAPVPSLRNVEAIGLALAHLLDVGSPNARIV